MMEIKYPEIIYCPRCEMEIRLDYSGKHNAKTSDVLKLWVEIPSTGESAANLRKKIVALPPIPIGMVICQNCKTILGVTG